MELCATRGRHRIPVARQLHKLFCVITAISSYQATPSLAEFSRILIIADGDAGHAQQVVAATTNQITADLANTQGKTHNIVSISVNQLGSTPVAQNDILIAVGRKTSLALAKQRPAAPTVFALIPQNTWLEIQRCCKMPEGQATAIYLDQPLDRQFALMNLAFPQRRVVGTLLGPSNKHLLKRLGLAAKLSRHEQNVEVMENDAALGSTLGELLKSTEVFLALPDPTIYNRNNIFPILMCSYKARVPVVGYSHAMVKAGAVVGLFSTPTDIGRQVSELVIGLLHSQPLPTPEHPKYFRVEVNKQVARSLGITIGDDASLTRRLQGIRR